MSCVPLFHHFTEYLEEVHAYLKDIIGSDDLELLDIGADIRVGGSFIEVKACQEYTKSKHSNGNRRRGRFKFDHSLNGDFVLFVLMRENGINEKRLIEKNYVFNEILCAGLRTSINSSEIFS